MQRTPRQAVILIDTLSHGHADKMDVHAACTLGIMVVAVVAVALPVGEVLLTR
jgi:hypothetical protein